MCSKCSTETSLENLFRDKAIERDLRKVSFSCTHKHCTWKGINLEYRVIKLQYWYATDNNCL